MSSSQNKVKQYETATERRGAKLARESERSMFQPLQFDHCALSLQRFENPVLSNVSHYVFDITNLVPFVQQHKQDPITGEPMTLKDITKLHFHKNADGKYICPSTYKEFTDFSHIVAIKTSGEVYSWDAVQELNIKANNWNCLETGKPFKKSDIITIQDPKDPTRRNVKQFHHIKVGKKVETKSETGIRTDPSIRRVLGKMGEERQKAEKEEKQRKKREREQMKELGVMLPEDEEEGQGEQKKPATSANFTMMGFVGKKENIIVIPPKKTAKKGLVKLYTTCGKLDICLHCDIAPVACENFLKLCEKGYYKNVKMHRMIPKFMVQGGDPTGTGRGGESFWGKPFQDEFSDKLKHSKRGMVSMANSGPRTNGSQFFILFGAKQHLDGKHTVFGEVTSGMETLDEMENVPTNSFDAPLFDIFITDAAVIFDPFLHLDEEKLEDIKQEEEEKNNAEKGEWFSNPSASYAKPKVVKEGVGKYIAPSALKDKEEQPTLMTQINFGSAVVSNSKRGKKKTSDFGSAF